VPLAALSVTFVVRGEHLLQQDRQRTIHVTLGHVRVTTIAVEKQ
jgi:hypothetical protein